MEIYKVINKITGCVYIGKTIKTYKIRKCNHYSQIKLGSKTYFHKALRKYDKKDFVWEKICDAKDEKELYRKEISFIRHYKNAGFKLYNTTDGGEGTTGYKHTALTKERITNSLVGIKHTRERRINSTIGNGGGYFNILENNIVIDTFILVQDCAEKYNLIPRNIRKCLSGERKTHKGYTFRRITNELPH